MKLSVTGRLVMPSRIGFAVAGRPLFSTTLSFPAGNTKVHELPTTKSVSPTSSIRTRRSIWRMMISMCLSLIVTPWSR
jgi:hypothetical protein